MVSNKRKAMDEAIIRKFNKAIAKQKKYNNPNWLPNTCRTFYEQVLTKIFE